MAQVDENRMQQQSSDSDSDSVSVRAADDDPEAEAAALNSGDGGSGPSTPTPVATLASAGAEVNGNDDAPSASVYAPIKSRRASRRQSRTSHGSSKSSNRSSQTSVSGSARALLSSVLPRRFSGVSRGSDDEPDPQSSNAGSRARTGGLGRSVRGSTAYTWAQLAVRRSTELDRRPSDVSGVESSAAGLDGNDPGAQGAAAVDAASGCGSCFRSALADRGRDLLRSAKKASKHPRSIVLPTLVTFAVLAAAGIFAIVHSSHQYHEEQSQKLLEEARELAYELDDVLLGALLPLFTLQEMAGQFDEFRDLQPEIAERNTFVREDGRSFKNVTEVCADREVMELYRFAADSIVQSSKMADFLLNVQLQPAGTICLNHPQSTTYRDGMQIDHTKAIGLDRIHDEFLSKSSRASIDTREVSTTGSIIMLVQDSTHQHNTPHQTLIFWTPIFAEGLDLVTLDDEERFQNFWGFAEVLLDWDEILRQVKLYEFFEERDMTFALVEEMEGGGYEVMEASTGDKPYLTRGAAREVEASIDVEPHLTRDTAREALPLQARENWVLLVDVPPPNVGDPSWAIWGSILVILGSFLVSLALMLVLVNRKDHEELLCRCIPRDIVMRLHTGETVIEKYDVATICFIDIVSFTTMSGSMKAHEVMEMLQILFREFDQLTEKHNCFNTETIGDAYITVSGGPEGNDATAGAANIAAFALDAVDAVKNLQFQDGKKIKIRLGVASGPVVAGVIGTVNVPKFTLFGETTSRAEEMEKTSLPLQVQCSEETMKLLRGNFRINNSFQCKRRKEDGHEDTYWIVRPSKENRSHSSELDHITEPAARDDISTVNSTTFTQSDLGQSTCSESFAQSEPKQSTVSTWTEENEMPTSNAEEKSSRNDESVRSTSGAQSDFESYLASDNKTWQKNEDTKANPTKTRLQNTFSNVNIPLRSIGQMFRVAASNRRILLGTLLTFAILCGAGLAILFIFADAYEKDKYQYATDLAKKADRWLEKEIAKALLPLFAMSELVKVVGKWYDLPFKIERTHQYNKGTSVFNNATGICDDPAYVNPFVDIASSIKQSSGMQKILVNVQLAPIGVLCLTYPKNNTDDFPPGVYLDTSGAIGLNLFDTPNRARTSKAAVHKKDATIQGPIKLAQGNLSVVDEALIARYPVFVDGHNMTIDGNDYPFWGLTIVLMDWDKLKSKFGLYNFFSRAYMEFRMTRYDSFNQRLVVIANSSNHEILGDHNSISVDLETSDDAWTLIVGFDDGFNPPWLGRGIASVVVGSMLLSLLVMMVLAVTKMNKMLLYRMMPRKAIISVERGKTFVERDSEATILFSHLIGFEKMSGEMSPKDFLLMLTQLYTEFDKLALKYHCTKIETIGAYYIVKGPGPDLCGRGEREGVARIALFALHAMDLVRNYQYKGVQLQIRTGFASGPIVSGVIGSGGLPKYTVFGDTVNFSSRMESTSLPMMIQCPHRTWKLLRNSPEFTFELEDREEEGQLGVYVKGKGQTMTYWLKGYTDRRASDFDIIGTSLRSHEETAKGDTSPVNNEADSCVQRDLDLDIEAMGTGVRDKRVSFKE